MICWLSSVDTACGEQSLRPWAPPGGHRLREHRQMYIQWFVHVKFQDKIIIVIISRLYDEPINTQVTR